MTKRARAAVLGSLLLAGTGLAVSSSIVGPVTLAAAAPASASLVPAAIVCPTNASTVTVQGYGSAEAQPNELTISLGVQTQSSTAAVALSTNSAKANALIAKLEADGVTGQDLQTSGLTVQPVYTGPKQLITSYQVVNNVTVTLYDLTEAGKIIDDAASAAGNAIVVNSIAFSVKDDTALLGQARAAAVRQATGQAQVMAAAAGMSLGHLCSLVDNSSEPTPVSFASGVPGKATAPSTPVQPGEQQVTANVTAVYELVAAAPAS
jgi:uncharacterized protein YggE